MLFIYTSIKLNLLLYLLCNTEACNEFAGPISPSFSPPILSVNSASFEEMLRGWQTIGNTVSDLTSPRFESRTSKPRTPKPRTSRYRDERFTTWPTGNLYLFASLGKKHYASWVFSKQFYLNMFRWEDKGKLKVTGLSSHVSLFFDWLEEMVKQYTKLKSLTRNILSKYMVAVMFGMNVKHLSL